MTNPQRPDRNRPGTSIATRVEDRGVALSRRTTRDVRRGVERSAGEAIVRSAHVESAAYVTHAGLTFTGKLSQQEDLLSRDYPEARHRFQRIVDEYADVVVDTVARFRR